MGFLACSDHPSLAYIRQIPEIKAGFDSQSRETSFGEELVDLAEHDRPGRVCLIRQMISTVQTDKTGTRNSAGTAGY